MERQRPKEKSNKSGVLGIRTVKAEQDRLKNVAIT